MSEVVGVCRECGARMVNLPTGAGSVCTSGCRGLGPLLPQEVHKANVRAGRIARLPQATLVKTVVARTRAPYADKRLYVVSGMEGYYRRLARKSPSLTRWTPGAVLASCDGQPVELVRFEL